VNMHIEKLVLWLNNGMRREVEFLPNKVNVITGRSSTGKTEIMHIIDYCLFSSSVKISEDVLNENVDWYGIVVFFNSKKYTIARKSLFRAKCSDQYYFSSQGEIPQHPHANISENAAKSLIEPEFGIDSDVVMPFGGSNLSAKSKISLRYFLMFNTISGNIIESDQGVFFDKQQIKRYREALPRIFDLAIGIENVENVLKKEIASELDAKIARLEKKLKAVSTKSDLFQKEQSGLIKKAKELSLVDPGLNLTDSMDVIRSLVDDDHVNAPEGGWQSNDEREYFSVQRKIQNLKRFLGESETYRKNMTQILDSLLPIKYLQDNFSEIVKTKSLSSLLNSLKLQLESIKKDITSQNPIVVQVKGEIKKLDDKRKVLENELLSTPSKIKSFGSMKEKYIFLGEIKAKMDLYRKDGNEMLEQMHEEIDRLKVKREGVMVADYKDQRQVVIGLIEEEVRGYIKQVSNVLENYSKHLPVFDYKNKILSLRKPKSAVIEHIGSSSNHMFLHLFFSLSMHEVAFINHSPFVAPFLIIDQPSRPYYGQSKNSDGKETFKHDSDRYKIEHAFKLLDTYVQNRVGNGGTFQMIVFEHVPKDIFERNPNVHLVEEFVQGNKLIPDHML